MTQEEEGCNKDLEQLFCFLKLDNDGGCLQGGGRGGRVGVGAAADRVGCEVLLGDGGGYDAGNKACLSDELICISVSYILKRLTFL